MKLETTRKHLYNLYGAENIYKVGYCRLQNLLNYENATGYTCGVYGWNCDIYEIDGVIIATGYRPIGTGYIDYELQKEYDEKAQAILCDYKNYEDQKEEVTKLLKQFIKEVKNNDTI